METNNTPQADQAVNAKAAQEQQAQNPAGEAQPQEQEGGAHE